jgi:hypothetical protein
VASLAYTELGSFGKIGDEETSWCIQTFVHEAYANEAQEAVDVVAAVFAQ